MVDNQALMMFNFLTAMKKLAVVGQDVNALVDCSDLIPVPPPTARNMATFPAGTNASDVQQACTESPFPVLSVDRKLLLGVVRSCDKQDTDSLTSF